MLNVFGKTIILEAFKYRVKLFRKIKKQNNKHIVNNLNKIV